MWQGVEMEDFVSGPRELLLKLVEENYPLPPKPDSFQQGLCLLFIVSALILAMFYQLRHLFPCCMQNCMCNA
jgi:hypothetical protein